MEDVSWKVFLLLLGSGVCSAFAGLQSIVVLEWLQPLLLLQFFHHAKILERKIWSILGFLVLILFTQTLGYTIAYAAELNDPAFTLTGILTVAAVSLVAWIVLLFVFVTAVYYEQRFPDAILAHPFCFPVVWMTVWHSVYAFSPLGATGHPVYTQHGIQPLVLTSSLWGLDGVLFLMGLTATLIHQRLQIRQEAKGSTISAGAGSSGIDGVDEIETYRGPYRGPYAPLGQNKAEFSKKVQRHDTLVKIWTGALIFFLLYSGVREVVFAGRFFEKGITDTIKPTVPVSCVLRQPSGLAETERLSSEFLWNSTSERARAGDAFIIWSETATAVYGEKGEEELLNRAKELLLDEQHKRKAERQSMRQLKSDEAAGPYLGLSYAVVLDGKELGQVASQENVFTLMAPDGTVGFRYEKTNPVPFVEKETIAGPGKLQAVKTPYGIVGAAICFDYQFPRLLMQSAYLHADIMLQPSWTWGPMADFQFKADAFRAVENGFTLIRCSSTGQSGIITAYNDIIDLRESTTTSVVTMELPISSKVFTLYPWGGFILGMLVEIVCAKYVFMAWLPLSWVLAVSTVFPGAINDFFVGDKFEDEHVGKKTFRRYKTRTRTSSNYEVAPRPFFARSVSSRV